MNLQMSYLLINIFANNIITNASLANNLTVSLCITISVEKAKR